MKYVQKKGHKNFWGAFFGCPYHSNGTKIHLDGMVLSDRKQRVKIKDRYSLWSIVLFDVLQRSILRPLLFDIFICNVLLF